MNDNKLIEKYNVPTPRYTSYPTVPYWDNLPIKQEEWAKKVKVSFDKTNNTNGISVYIHLPYCENICTFCGCNKRITRNHAVEKPYIDAVLKEWNIYLDIFKNKPNIKELHLGGGTPTFFSPESLTELINGIKENSNLTDDFEFSIEVHPNVTTRKQIKTLFDLGFRRISLGIQDFDPVVQEMINRPQSFENVEMINNYAREIGFTSINFDLVYGLPLQKEGSIRDTFEKVKKLRPDRIAFYSYAHVPWKSAGQRKFSENDLPDPETKRKLYDLGREILEKAGYVEIGMDHFALKTDSLYQAMINKKIHRNFMGYNSRFTELLIGLGVSSISDTWDSYAQNNKSIDDYLNIINSGKLALSDNHFLTDEDTIIRKHIANLMCNFETEWTDKNLQHDSLFKGLKRLREVENDGLVKIFPQKIEVTEDGKKFVRNICMALDSRLWNKVSSTRLFSMAI